MKKLKPCPFCGSNNIRIAGDRGGIRRIECMPVKGACGANILAKTDDEAIVKWNTRPAPPLSTRRDIGKGGRMTITYDIETKLPKPKWFQLRRKLSMWLLALAKKVYPENPEVWAFMSKIMADTMITGQAITRIDPMKFLKETNAETPEAKNDKEKAK